jgi:hypothetical protein
MYFLYTTYILQFRRKNRLQLVAVGFSSFFFSPNTEKPGPNLLGEPKPEPAVTKKRLQFGCMTGFFWLLQPDFGTLLIGKINLFLLLNATDAYMSYFRSLSQTLFLFLLS